MKILIPTPDTSIEIDVDVVEENIILLIRIYKIDKYQIQPLILGNTLWFKLHNWKISLIRKIDHVYLEWSPGFYSSFYSPKETICQQLERLHRHFIHPLARKIYELLKKAKVEDLPADILDTLKVISEKCEA